MLEELVKIKKKQRSYLEFPEILVLPSSLNKENIFFIHIFNKILEKSSYLCFFSQNLRHSERKMRIFCAQILSFLQ